MEMQSPRPHETSGPQAGIGMRKLSPGTALSGRLITRPAANPSARGGPAVRFRRSRRGRAAAMRAPPAGEQAGDGHDDEHAADNRERQPGADVRHRDRAYGMYPRI